MRRVVMAATIVAAIVVPMMSPVSAASRPTVVKFPKGQIDLGNLNDGAPQATSVRPCAWGGRFDRRGARDLLRWPGVAYEGLSFGAFKLTVTNMDTGKSITVNSSGPGGITADGLPVIGWGPWVIFEPISEGGIRFFHGRTEFVPVSYGSTPSRSPAPRRISAPDWPDRDVRGSQPVAKAAEGLRPHDVPIAPDLLPPNAGLDAPAESGLSPLRASCRTGLRIAQGLTGRWAARDGRHETVRRGPR